jgi:LysR family transcriptional regulator, low CO2-responsive transcriptional regulator
MHLTLRQLRLFEAVARNLSFTRAAEELCLTQPAVSIQMKQLETNTGLPLFEHIGKRLYLTPAGRELYAAARAIFARLGELETVFSEMKGIVQGPLNVCVVTTANYFAPHLLGAFLRQYPQVDVRLQAMDRLTIIGRLLANEDDLVILGQVPAELDLEVYPILDDPLVVVAPPTHPLRKSRRIPIARLAKEVFLLREPGSGTRELMQRTFAAAQVAPRLGMELGGSEAIKQAVLAGLGVSVLPMRSVALELANGCMAVLDVEGFPVEGRWHAVHLRGKKLPLVAQTFLEFVCSEGTKVMEDFCSAAPRLATPA